MGVDAGKLDLPVPTEPVVESRPSLATQPPGGSEPFIADAGIVRQEAGLQLVACCIDPKPDDLARDKPKRQSMGSNATSFAQAAAEFVQLRRTFEAPPVQKKEWIRHRIDREMRNFIRGTSDAILNVGNRPNPGT